MMKSERLVFARAVLDELSRPGDGEEQNPIQDLLWLALYSPDTKARLAAIRALALELEAEFDSGSFTKLTTLDAYAITNTRARSNLRLASGRVHIRNRLSVIIAEP